MEPTEPDASAVSFIRPLQEINERCISMLVAAARAARPDCIPLAIELCDILRDMTPEIRVRAARKAFLLVDLELANGSWWQSLQRHPARGASFPPRRGSFPRLGAIQLTRATLMLTWHALRADEQARYLLGVTPEVAGVIAGLALTEIDRIAERGFRHLRPRWEDRPAIWKQLLQSSQTPDLRRARESSLRGLQLIVGELL